MSAEYEAAKTDVEGIQHRSYAILKFTPFTDAERMRASVVLVSGKIDEGCWDGPGGDLLALKQQVNHYHKNCLADPNYQVLPWFSIVLVSVDKKGEMKQEYSKVHIRNEKRIILKPKEKRNDRVNVTIAPSTEVYFDIGPNLWAENPD